MLVFAAPDDADRRRQLDMLAFDRAAAQRRDVLVVDVAERLDALALCQLHGVAPGAFAVVLIERDGTVAARWSEPVPTAEIWQRIDARA